MSNAVGEIRSTLLALERDICRSLKGFVRLAWDVIEPSTPYIHNWHIEVICDHLEQVWRCEMNDLLINMPPRHQKSLTVAVFFPAWVWTLEPSVKWLFSSYAQSLSIRDSVKMRRLVESPWYQARWGNKFQLTSDQNQKIKFENNKAGYRMATSVGGSNTGEGGDIIVCLPAEETIWTERGPLPIGRVVRERLAIKVVAYDIRTGETVLSPIVGWHENPGRMIVEVELSDGAKIRCTADHRILTRNRGWVEAGALRESDMLPCPATTDVVRGFEQFVWDSQRDTISQHDSPMAPDASNGRDAIQPFIARDRFPLLVRRHSFAPSTFCVTVERYHNFVGGDNIIVANCDDPHNVEQRESDVMREGAIDWWSNVMSTRINDPKKRRRIVVMQRVHEHDLSGHLLDQGGWHHLNLPAEYEGGKCIVTGCVFHWDKDPRTEEGEPLWKERYGKAEIAQLKKDLKEFGAAAQLQQRPAPAEGGILKRHWWRYWCHPGQEETLPPVRVKLPSGEYKEIKPIPLPYAFDKEVQSWDMAFKDLATSSFVVGEQWGLKGPDCFLKDQIREQMDFTQTLESFRAFNRTHKRPSTKVVEDKANGPAIMSVLKKEIAGVQPHGVQGDKQARAAAYAHIPSAGNCYLPHPAIAPWVEGFINECATFPNSEYDDQVDTWSQAMDVLYAVDDPGIAITPEYSAQFHQARTALEPVPGLPSFRFWFQGLYPCCVIGQILSSGRIILLDCLLGEQNGGIEDLIDRKVSVVLAADYRGCTDWRDITNHPPLSKLSEASEHRLDQIIADKLQGSAEPGEPDFFIRLNAIKGLLSQTGRLTVNPAPTPGESKPWIHEALAGGYAYRKDQNGVVSKTEARKFHPLTSVGEALGHGLARIFVRKPMPVPKFNKVEATKRAKSYAV